MTRQDFKRQCKVFFYITSISLFFAGSKVCAQDDEPVETPPEVRIVLVENTDLGPDVSRLHYPLLLNHGKGFRIKCPNQNEEEEVIRGLGFISLPSTVVDPLSDAIMSSQPDEQPFLCPYSSKYKIKLYRHNPGTGEQFYLHFPTGLDERSYGSSLYIAGCSQLLKGLKLNLSQAINADPTPFFQDNIHKIDCFTGSPITVVAKKFSDWCMKKDLSAEHLKTVKALLNYSPQGVNSLGNELKCKEADTFLSGLTTLNLTGQQLVDIGPLSVFTNLTQLILANNKIEDVSPLSNLKGMTLLNLGQNKIQNVSALAGAMSLTELNLGSNTVGDLRPLSSLSNLKKLNLSSNALTNTSLPSIT